MVVEFTSLHNSKNLILRVRKLGSSGMFLGYSNYANPFDLRVSSSIKEARLTRLAMGTCEMMHA